MDDEMEMRLELDALGRGLPYAYDHASGRVEWRDGVQASVWLDADGGFHAVQISRQEVADGRTN